MGSERKERTVKKTSRTRKIALNAETLRQLETLVGVNGAAINTTESDCSQQSTPSNCQSCPGMATCNSTCTRNFACQTFPWCPIP